MSGNFMENYSTCSPTWRLHHTSLLNTHLLRTSCLLWFWLFNLFEPLALHLCTKSSYPKKMYDLYDCELFLLPEVLWHNKENNNPRMPAACAFMDMWSFNTQIFMLPFYSSPNSSQKLVEQEARWCEGGLNLFPIHFCFGKDVHRTWILAIVWE